MCRGDLPRIRSVGAALEGEAAAPTPQQRELPRLERPGIAGALDEEVIAAAGLLQHSRRAPDRADEPALAFYCPECAGREVRLLLLRTRLKMKHGARPDALSGVLGRPDSAAIAAPCVLVSHSPIRPGSASGHSESSSKKALLYRLHDDDAHARFRALDLAAPSDAGSVGRVRSPGRTAQRIRELRGRAGRAGRVACLQAFPSDSRATPCHRARLRLPPEATSAARDRGVCRPRRTFQLRRHRSLRPFPLPGRGAEGSRPRAAAGRGPALAVWEDHSIKRRSGETRSIREPACRPALFFQSSAFSPSSGSLTSAPQGVVRRAWTSPITATCSVS